LVIGITEILSEEDEKKEEEEWLTGGPRWPPEGLLGVPGEP
jgi:hypothetical protein